MKKILLSLVMCLTTGISAMAQYQIANSDFEAWAASSGEPDHWHGFKSAKGSFAGMAKGTLAKSDDKRPGSTGSYSAVITSASTLGVINNGTFTTGQLQAGSMTAANTANHAEMDKTSTATDKNGDKFYMPLTGHPDAMKVWIKFSQKTAQTTYKYASASAILFDGSYYQDPEDKEYANVVAKAKNTQITTCGWTELTIPFVYESNDVEPAAILVTFGTNATPGKGSSGDQVFVDDLELIYYSELASATFDDKDVTFAEGAATVDDLYDASKLALTLKGRGASSELSYDEASGLLTITVKGEDFSENSSNSHTYTIQFNIPAPEATLSATYDGQAISFTEYAAQYDGVYHPELLQLETTDADEVVQKFYDGETGLLTLACQNSGEAYTIRFAAPVSSKSYTDYLVVDVNDEKSAPQESSMVVYNMSDGSKTLVLKNFVLDGIPVGNISLAGVETDKEGAFTTTQTINISNGDDPSQDSWIGPFIGDIPVVMTGTISEDKFVAHIDIDMQSTLEQIIEVFYGYSYSRSGLTAGKWGSICQPFSFPADVVANSGVKFYSIQGKSADGRYVSMEEVTQVEAGVPYLFQAESDKLEMIGGTAYASAPNNDSANGLVGVYGRTNVPSDCYIVTNNKLAKGDGNTVGANRAYIDLNAVPELTSEAKGIRFYLDGADGVSGVEAATGKANRVYNLAGLRIAQPSQRGVYIVDGKKVLVK